jgi:hypothetical protein
MLVLWASGSVIIQTAMTPTVSSTPKMSAWIGALTKLGTEMPT